MQQTTVETPTFNKYVNLALWDITKNDDWIRFLSHFVFMLEKMITCEVQCVDEEGDDAMGTPAGDTLPELSTTPADILSNLCGERILLPESMRESLYEWATKIAPYTAMEKLHPGERDEVAQHLVHLTHFLFDEVVNPALKNTYPAIEGK